MAAEKVQFETHANVNHVETGDLKGGLLRIENGETFETADPQLIQLLDDLHGVKRAAKPEKKGA